MGEIRSQGERPEGGRGGRGRWGATRKMELVLRILKGEDLDTLSREVKVTAARLAQWRDEALASMQSGLKSREADGRDAEIRSLRAKVGELMMDKELLEAFVERVDPAHRPPLRRPKS
jgi:transposase